MLVVAGAAGPELHGGSVCGQAAGIEADAACAVYQFVVAGACRCECPLLIVTGPERPLLTAGAVCGIAAGIQIQAAGPAA